MAEGATCELPPSPAAPGSPMQIISGPGVFSVPASPRAPTVQTSTQYALTSSPTGKYVSPRLRGGISPASPSSGTLKRTLAAVEELSWRNNQMAIPNGSVELISPTSSSPNRLPPHKVLVAHWGTANFATPAGDGSSTCAVVNTSGPTAPDLILQRENGDSRPSASQSGPLSPAARAGPTSPVEQHSPAPESDPPATPAFRRLFRSACRASNTGDIFVGARIKHGRFSAAALLLSLLYHSTRGIILSFSHRAPSYDHFRVWLDSHFLQAGILIDDASQLSNDFFLVLLHDHANQLLALKQKLFFLNKNDARSRTNPISAPIAPTDAPVADTTAPVASPGPDQTFHRPSFDVPSLADGGFLAPVARSLSSPTRGVWWRVEPVVVEPVTSLPPSPTLPANLRIRTGRNVAPPVDNTTSGNLPATTSAALLAHTSEGAPKVSSSPSSPAISSKGNSAGSKSWADYSLDFDGAATPPVLSPGGSRQILSPLATQPLDRQRERSPEARQRESHHCSIKAAARNSQRQGRGAGRRGKR
ncbi:unnamed protein product [Calypogeia fissa]